MCYDLIQTITGVFGLFSIVFLWLQIRSEAKWNKLNCSLNKIDEKLLLKNVAMIDDAGIDMADETMNDEEFSKFTNEANYNLLEKARDILNMLEELSILYNMNALNKHFAYEAYSENIIFFYLKFKRIIDLYREEYDEFYFINLEKCFYTFFNVNQNEQKNIKKRKEKFEKIKAKNNAKLEKREKNIKFTSSIYKNKF
jgi:hypothetical protein